MVLTPVFAHYMPDKNTAVRIKSTKATLPRQNQATNLSQIWNGMQKFKNILILLNNILKKLNFFIHFNQNCDFSL